MSDTCPKCGQCLRIYNAPHEEWFCGSTRYPKKTGEFKQATECELRAQLAALTQRAEQAERERDNWRSLYKELHCRLWCATPEEFEGEARTEGINHEDTLMECGRMISAQANLTAAEAEVKRLRDVLNSLYNEEPGCFELLEKLFEK